MSGSKTISTSETKIEALKFQSSAYGGTLPVVYGVTRIPGNLGWYGDFKAIPHTTTQSSGGKGGSPRIQSTTYTYQSALIMLLCEGPIAGITKTWKAKNIYPGPTPLTAMGLSLKTGAIGQAVWSYMNTNHPTQALGYSGVSYVYTSAYDLGSSAAVDNHNFEVQAFQAYTIAGVPDAVPAAVVSDLLQSTRYGVEWPSTAIDTTAWDVYCRAANLLMSPAFTEQMSAVDIVNKMCKATNTGPVWSQGVLKFIPYGDATITGNGSTYTPNVTPIYDFNSDHFLDKENPVRLMRKPQNEAYNHFRIEFLDRANDYNIAIAEARDQANIDTYGIRSADVLQMHWVCDASIAQAICQLMLQRVLYIRNTYTFKLPENYSLLEPMDLVTLTDDALKLNLTPVRITKVSSPEEPELTIEAEDFPLGVAAATLFPNQDTSSFTQNYNEAPGDVNTPIIFEAPAQHTDTGLEVMVAVDSASSTWGGCEIWVSLDGTSYALMSTVRGPSRYGKLTGPITGGVLPVLLNSGALNSGTVADANALVTLCYVGGANKEFLSYQTATLTGPLAYDLGGLVRGAYNSPTTFNHATNDPFVRVDNAVGRSGLLDLSYIGKTIYFKFCSFNVYGGAKQTLADVSAYPYTVTGAGAQLLPGIAGKGVELQVSSVTFKQAVGGTQTPANITLTALRKGLLEGTVTWSVTSGTATLTGTGDTRTLAATDLTTDTAVVQASITDAVGTYSASVTINRVYDGVAGAPGPAGPAGTKGAQVTLYQWNTATPGDPNGSSTFTWATGAHSAYTGTNGWVPTVPSNPGTPGIQLWTATKGITDTATATSTTVNWSTGFTKAAWAANGLNGTNGTNGSPGANGLQTAIATVYQWPPTIPSGPTGTATWTWSSMSFGSAPSGWTLAPSPSPSAGYTLWAAEVRITDSATNATTGFNWSSASVVAKGVAGTNGTPGPAGSPGPSGAPGSTGAQGASARTAYSRIAGNPTPVSGFVTVSGDNRPSSTQSNATWGLNVSWSASDPNPSSTDTLYQTDGIYDPATGNTVWATPYQSSLKVGTLSAITTNTGTLNATGDIVSSSGAFRGGSIVAWSWPAAGSGPGFYLGQNGLLLGNANDGKYLEVTSSGDIYAPNFTILSGSATFSGNLSGAGGTFAGNLSAAGGTFSGTLTAAAVNAVNTININGNAVTIPVGAALSSDVSVTGTGNTTILSTTLDTGGQPLLVFCDISASNPNSGLLSNMVVELRLNGTVIRQFNVPGTGSSNGQYRSMATYVASPGTGTLTVSLTARMATTGTTAAVCWSGSSYLFVEGGTYLAAMGCKR